MLAALFVIADFFIPCLTTRSKCYLVLRKLYLKKCSLSILAASLADYNAINPPEITLHAPPPSFCQEHRIFEIIPEQWWGVQ